MIFKEILTGVKYLHDNNIYHRDLKIENIIVNKQKEKITCKLIDFGFAVHLQPNQHISKIFGTPSYMAPEIYQRKK